MEYLSVRQNAALVSGKDFLTFLANASHGSMIVRIDAQGMGTASGASEIAVCRATVSPSGTAPTAITPTPTSTLMGAATAAVYGGSWGTSEGTVNTAIPVHMISLNANGQRYYWEAKTWSQGIFVAPGTAAANYLCFRQTASTNTITLKIWHIEV